MRTPWFCLFVGWLLLTGAASGQPKRPTPIDPTKVDEDFAVQGEYVGVIAEDGKEQKYGVRVGIAQNAGEFKAIAYRGGLPGDGWDKKLLDEKNKRLAEWPGQTRDGVTTFPKFLRGSERRSCRENLDSLDTVIAQFRKDLTNPKLPFVAGQIAPLPKGIEKIQAFNRALLNLPTRTPHTGVVQADDLNGKDIHFDSTETRKLGLRYAEEMIRLQGK